MQKISFNAQGNYSKQEKLCCNTSIFAADDFVCRRTVETCTYVC